MEQISYKLATFEGPLDLLLFLIAKHKLNIYDIEISVLVEQYMSYINEMKEADLEIASEFLEMASHLIYIKTAMLLPKHEEATDLKKELEGRLLEYSLLKIAAEKLKGAYCGNDFFVREPTVIDFDKTYNGNHSPEELLEAFSTACGKGQRRLPPPKAAFSGIVSKRIVSVISRTIFVLKNVIKKGAVPFRDLFKTHDRSENVATFLAILELIKSKKIGLNSNDEVVLNEAALKRKTLSADASAAERR